MEGVGADTQVETLLSAVLDQVLVGADTGGFKSLGRQLLVLIGDKVAAERELVDGGTLTAKIEDTDLKSGGVDSVSDVSGKREGNTDLGVGYTAVVAGLGVRLVLAVAVAASGTATHGDKSGSKGQI